MEKKEYYKRAYMKKRFIALTYYYGMDRKSEEWLYMQSPREYPLDHFEAKQFCERMAKEFPEQNFRKYSPLEWFKHIIGGTGGINNKRIYLKKSPYAQRMWYSDLDLGYFVYPNNTFKKVWDSPTLKEIIDQKIMKRLCPDATGF